jgi:LysR family transcriptional regulator, carnitine catabolism transcriptional activator
MNITFRQIRAFVAVAQHGRFSIGASRLHVTPSALSMLIRQLEGQIGARLFDRHTRMVRLTELGAEFLPVARKVLADLESALAQSRDRSMLRRGRVSIATSTVLAATLMPWVISGFSAGRPGITVVLRDVVEQEIKRLVRAGEVDLGVGTSLDPDAEAELEEVLLLEDRLVALLPADHALAQKRSVSWRELAAQPLIVLGSGSPLRALVERAFRSNGIAVMPAYEVSFSSTVISMVAAGMGVAALPVNARQVTPKVRVAVRPLVRPVVPRRVSLFKRRDSGLSPAAEAFHLSLREHVRQGGYPG